MHHNNKVTHFSLISAFTFVVSLLFSIEAAAATTKSELQEVRFNTDEGTWISVDSSPDDKEIVFDLLGDLYIMPGTGGTAKNLLSGRSYDHAPRWSPDGKYIAFISDRSGSDNLWVMDATGSNPRRVSADEQWGTFSPAWSPDSKNLVVSRRFGEANELWRYNLDGQPGESLTNTQEVRNPQGPVYSADGRHLYFSSGSKTLEPTFEVWQIYRLDLQSRQVVQITTRYGHSIRPEISPDGRYMAFARSLNGVDGLWIRDLTNDRERLLSAGINHGIQPWPIDVDLHPGFSFTADSQELLISYRGKINRVSVSSGSVSEIPFEAEVIQHLTPRFYRSQSLKGEQWRASVIAWPSLNPDGQGLAFEALGKIWYQANLESEPQRLTTQNNHREYTPAVSPDGRWVAYVSWDDEEHGHVWKVPLSGGVPQRLTQVARQYAHPAWSPDGKNIAVTWQRPELSLRQPFFPEGTLFLVHHDLGYLSASGGELQSISTITVRQFFSASLFSKPVFNDDGTRLYFRDLVDRQHQLVSVALDGSDRRVLANFPANVHVIVPSENASKVAFADNDQLYVVTLPASKEPLEINPATSSQSLRQLSEFGGDYPGWSDSGVLVWANGHSVYQWKEGAREPTERIISLEVPRYHPDGNVVLRGARIITMKGDEVIGKGDIVIANNRIAAIGKSGKVKWPKGATIYDLRGKTIMPGIVDAHHHGQMTGNEILAETRWQFAAVLAYGITSSRDPAGPTRDMFRHVDLIESGAMLGPRLTNTGLPSYGGHSMISDIKDARVLVRNRKLHGARFIKQHSQPRRDVRQWLQQAATEESLMIIAEGNSVKQHVNLILDGYTSIEHANHAGALYKDMKQLYVHSGVFYVPTLLVGYALPRGLDYYYQNWDWYKDEKVQRFMQPDTLMRYARHRIAIDNNDYFFPKAAVAATNLMRSGGKVALGSHGNHPGLGAHWELWSLVMGGMTPHEAMHAATVVSAEVLGLTDDIGTLEVGKMADLIVLNENPLKDIHNSLKIHLVMKNGELFEGDTLDKLWPQHQALRTLF